ncbi:inorganic diphosphatase [Powellomyces hirtus]|uniref:Inorganic diphosphatase n=1 Tax=Powellomyces hirtus TaxID=109895 RepID=A0A507E331_9FUNG|nr:inorganic diphosphatase [Powellomyces hirtus]
MAASTVRTVFPLVRFLAQAKTVLSQQQPMSTPVTVVIGNEAADLDSLVSAMSLAYLLSLRHQPQPPPHPIATAQPLPNHHHYLPVISIPRRDFALRTECPFTLSTAFGPHLSTLTSSLTFLDEIDLDALAASRLLSIILVDHNRLAPTLARFSGCVVGVVDHHVDEGLYSDVGMRVVQPVGSAVSLVTEMWMTDKRPVEQGLAVCMLAAILIDTVNLVEEYGRVTETDRKAVTYLLPFARGPTTEPTITTTTPPLQHSTSTTTPLTSTDRDFLTALYTGVHTAKTSISTLSSLDLLRKDYKECVVGDYRLGISSVSWHVMGETGWAAREALNNNNINIHDINTTTPTASSTATSPDTIATQQHGFEDVKRACAAYANLHALDIHIVMTAFNHTSGPNPRGFERELLITFYNKLAPPPTTPTTTNHAPSILSQLEHNPQLNLSPGPSSLKGSDRDMH